MTLNETVDSFNEDKQLDFKEKLCTFVGNNVTTEDISLVITAGSINVDATITTPTEDAANEAANQFTSTSKDMLSNALGVELESSPTVTVTEVWFDAPSPPPPTRPPTEEEVQKAVGKVKSWLDGAMIALIVVLSVLGVCLLCCCFVIIRLCCCKKKKKHDDPDAAKDKDAGWRGWRPKKAKDSGDAAADTADQGGGRCLCLRRLLCCCRKKEKPKEEPEAKEPDSVVLVKIEDPVVTATPAQNGNRAVQFDTDKSVKSSGSVRSRKSFQKKMTKRVEVSHAPGETERMIGASFRVSSRDLVVVKSLVKGLLAEKKGVLVGSVLIRIDGESVKGMEPAEVLKMLAAPNAGERGSIYAAEPRHLVFSVSTTATRTKPQRTQSGYLVGAEGFADDAAYAYDIPQLHPAAKSFWDNPDEDFSAPFTTKPFGSAADLTKSFDSAADLLKVPTRAL